MVHQFDGSPFAAYTRGCGSVGEPIPSNPRGGKHRDVLNHLSDRPGRLSIIDLRTLIGNRVFPPELIPGDRLLGMPRHRSVGVGTGMPTEQRALHPGYGWSNEKRHEQCPRPDGRSQCETY